MTRWVSEFSFDLLSSHPWLSSQLLDYKRNPVNMIESCANLLIKIFTNIIDQPNEEKYRTIKTSKIGSITGVKGGTHLLTMAGFQTKLIDEIEYVVFAPDPSGIKASILKECREVLLKAMILIQDKADRKKKVVTDKESREMDTRRVIAAQMEEDKKWRKVKNENLVQQLAQEKEAKEKGEAKEADRPSASAQETADAVAAAALERLTGKDNSAEGKEGKIKQGVGAFHPPVAAVSAPASAAPIEGEEDEQMD